MTKYLLTVISSAIICSIVVNLFEKNSTFRYIGRLLASIFLAITVISPLFKLEIPNLKEYQNILEGDCAQVIAEGEEFYQSERRNIITEHIEAYISDKAVALGVDLEVSVRLSDGDPPIPNSVELCGSISPYAKKAMETIIAQDIGIPKEWQTWK